MNNPVFVCFNSGDEICHISFRFNNRLRYLRNASPWNTEAGYLVTVLQGHPSCITDVLVTYLLHGAESFLSS
jgi:hypothetical protein